jgi:HAD superfamily hydrolase (TIGR01450 family)
MCSAEPATIDTLLTRFDTLLLDAYGVLVDQQGPLPGAAALIERLNREQRSYFILTNSASRLPETMAEGFAAAGLAIPAGRILSSGMLLSDHFSRQRLQGARCLVLGPEAAVTYVRRAGGEVVALEPDSDAEVIVLADQKGFDLQYGMDLALSLCLRRLDEGKPLTLLLCNPDLIYPVGPARYGLTAGAMAAMLEAVLAERYPESPPRFERLGKPHPPIFAAAARQASGTMVMLGDQLATDILGAQRFGIPAALVLSGLARQQSGNTAIIPDFVIESLDT